MERSNYEAFMDCLNPLIQITRAILCGVVLWEKIQECDALGIPYTEIDTEDAAREVDRRLAMEREYLYVLALKEWAEAGLSSRTIKTDEAAADRAAVLLTKHKSILNNGGNLWISLTAQLTYCRHS